MRPNWGRAVFTRQTLLNVASMLIRVTSSDTTSAITPTAVSWPVFREKSRRWLSIARAEPGTKLEKIDRKSVGEGRGVSERVDDGGRRIIQKKSNTEECRNK